MREVLVPGYWRSQAEAPTWAHGAHSLARGTAPWEMRFKVPQAAEGVVVGPAAQPSTAGDARTHIKQGFYISGGQILPWATQAAPPDAPMQMLGALPAWTPETEFALRADGKYLYWLVNGLAVARAGDVLAGGEVLMAAALYGPFDGVADAAFEAQVVGAVANLKVSPLVLIGQARSAIQAQVTPTLYAHNYANHLVDRRQPVLIASSRGVHAVLVDRRMPRVFAYGIPGVAARVMLQATPFMAAHGYAEGFAFLKVQPVLRITQPLPPASEDTGVMFAAMHAEKLPGMGQIAFETGALQTRIHPTVRRDRALHNRVHGQDRTRGSKLVHQILTQRLGVAVDMRGSRLLEGRLYEVLVSADRLLVGAVLDVQMTQLLQGQDALAANRLVDSQLLERLGLHAGVSNQALMEAMVRELLGVTVLNDLGAPSEVWSVTERGQAEEESTSYTDYPFTGFAQIGERYFGASETGLYELEGDTDDGAPIEAAIDLGQRDLGTDAIKSLSNAYVSTNASTPMRLRVELGGQQYTYQTRGADTAMRTQRFDLGRGLRGHFFGLELMNTDGADFEVGGMEFVAQESKRRI